MKTDNQTNEITVDSPHGPIVITDPQQTTEEAELMAAKTDTATTTLTVTHPTVDDAYVSDRINAIQQSLKSGLAPEQLLNVAIELRDLAKNSSTVSTTVNTTANELVASLYAATGQLSTALTTQSSAIASVSAPKQSTSNYGTSRHAHLFKAPETQRVTSVTNKESDVAANAPQK